MLHRKKHLVYKNRVGVYFYLTTSNLEKSGVGGREAARLKRKKREKMGRDDINGHMVVDLVPKS